MSDEKKRPSIDHVLLIGIDVYDGDPRSWLHGCVNDIDVIQGILIKKVGIQPDRIRRLAAPRSGEKHATEVPEQKATLANIRKELGRLGADLGEDGVMPGDRVFIYYSGHGAQITVVDDNTGTKHVCEALVPKDQVVDLEEQYLFDWELNELLSAIAARTSSVSFILDCCCSQGATRALPRADPNGPAVRLFQPSKPWHWPADKPFPDQPRQRGLMTRIAGSVASCQVVAACMSDESARESRGEDGVFHGELTRAFAAQIEALGDFEFANLRWGRIWSAVVAEVSRVNPAQHPWSSSGPARKVFGGPPENADAGYGVTREGDTYVLGVGSLFGVTKDAELAVYGSEPPKLPPPGSPEDQELAPHIIRVTEAERAKAKAVAVDKPFELPAGARARLVKAGEAARIRVRVVPPNAAIEASLAASPLLELVEASEPSEVTLFDRHDGTWALRDDVFDRGELPEEPWLVRIPAASMAAHAREVVELYHAYSAPLRLAKNCQDLPSFLRLSVHDASRAAQMTKQEAQNLAAFPELPAGEDAPYVLRVGETEDQAVNVCFGVRNDSEWALWVTLVACNNSGTVDIFSQAMVPSRSTHVFWLEDNIKDPIPATRLKGRPICVDRIVAIGTTNRDASLTHLEQDRPFNALFGSTTRELGKRSKAPPPPPPELWTSAVTAIRLIPR